MVPATLFQEMKMQIESSPLFLIGQNSRGQWISQKQSGQCGGLFISHAAAVKFALLENGHRREAVITVPGVFELGTHENAFTVAHGASSSPTLPQA